MKTARRLRGQFRDYKLKRAERKPESENDQYPSALRHFVGPTLLSFGSSVSVNYWFGVGCFLAGLGVTLSEVLFERWFRKHRFVQVMGILSVLGIGFCLAKYVVFVPLKLQEQGFYRYSAPAPGQVVGGIVWQPQWGELRLTLINDTDISFTNLDLNIRPDQPVAKIGQTSSLAGVSFITPENQQYFHDPNSSDFGLTEMGTEGPGWEDCRYAQPFPMGT